VLAVAVANACVAGIGWPEVTQTATRDEHELLERLRAGDEQAFAHLVDRCHATTLAVALAHVRSRAIAEEVVGEAWMAVIRGLDDFDGRTSLRTWILRIAVDIAKARGRDAGSAPSVSLASEGEGEPAVDPDRFRGPGDRYPGGWASFPESWPEERLLARETLACVQDAIRALPSRQQDVIILRDVEGCPAEEVCAALDITDGNQRILLHRARGRVRAAVEEYFGAVEKIDYDAIKAELARAEGRT
jgi:RNA polymerase sigma-70 factor (ECF subfamily)